MYSEEGQPSFAQELGDISLQLIRCGHKILGMGIKLRELTNIVKDGRDSPGSVEMLSVMEESTSTTITQAPFDRAVRKRSPGTLNQVTTKKRSRSSST